MTDEYRGKKTIFSQSLDAAGLLKSVQRNIIAGEVGEKLLNWQCSPQDMQLIEEIVARGLALWASQNIHLDKQLALMDIAACHCNGCPLELLRFLMSDAPDFVHDFAGIGQHIDKKSGKLLHDFRPIFRKLLQ